MTTAQLTNHLINRLSPEERAVLFDATVPFEFEVGYIFCEAGDPVTFIHFVYSGIVSAVTSMKDGRTIETFMIGNEGVTTPAAVAVPVRSYSRLVGQARGQTRRIEINKLKLLCETRPVLRNELALYAANLQGELEQSGACNALHRADQRLAKWLLRCHDRIDGDTLMLTQEYLASLLGSQRTTVNEAAQALQKAGAITYSRGRVTILDRDALERAACECYSIVQTDQAAIET